MRNLKKKFGQVKQLVESEYWAKRGSTSSKITNNPYTLKNALLQDFFRNGGINPAKFIPMLVKCDGFTASLGKKKKKYLIYLASTNPAKVAHEFTHVAMSRLRAEQKKVAGDYAEEVMAYSIELEAIAAEDKTEYQRRLTQSLQPYLERFRTNPALFSKDTMGRVLSVIIHKNFKTVAERAMIRERLARKYFIDPESALKWVTKEIQISKTI